MNKVMSCVESVKYKIKINGELSDEIVPGIGLRKGDPLSP